MTRLGTAARIVDVNPFLLPGAGTKPTTYHDHVPDEPHGLCSRGHVGPWMALIPHEKAP
jgi:hypothetical protein